MGYKTIPAEDLRSALKNGDQVIDVRSPGEYRAEHVRGAELHPLDSFDAEAFCKEQDKERPTYVLCQSGKRACQAAEKLSAAGHEQVYVVEGGTDAAKKTDLEIERGKGTISIERQVRIAAGLLVVIGTLLGLAVHGGFYALPIFVGSGLVFAGVTDYCGMGMLLAKMPWNK